MTWANYEISQRARRSRRGVSEGRRRQLARAGVERARRRQRLAARSCIAAARARRVVGLPHRLRRERTDQPPHARRRRGDRQDAVHALRATLVLAQSERLCLLARPITAPLYGARLVVAEPADRTWRPAARSRSPASARACSSSPAARRSRSCATMARRRQSRRARRCSSPACRCSSSAERSLPLPPELFAARDRTRRAAAAAVIDARRPAGSVLVVGHLRCARDRRGRAIRPSPRSSYFGLQRRCRARQGGDDAAARERPPSCLRPRQRADQRERRAGDARRDRDRDARQRRGRRARPALRAASAPRHPRERATPAGSASTLQVRVNDVPGRSVRSLFGSGPDDRVFATRTTTRGRPSSSSATAWKARGLPAGRTTCARRTARASARPATCARARSRRC